MPNVPEGEDDVSFERHNRVLKSEWTKSNRNALMVEQLMERTFPMRRRGILEAPADVQTIFDHYPFLQDPTQVCYPLLYCTYIMWPTCFRKNAIEAPQPVPITVQLYSVHVHAPIAL